MGQNSVEGDGLGEGGTEAVTLGFADPADMLVDSAQDPVGLPGHARYGRAAQDEGSGF